MSTEKHILTRRRWLGASAAMGAAAAGGILSPQRLFSQETGARKAAADGVSPAADTPHDMGARWELFVDNHLIARAANARLRLHEPVRREVVLVTDRPWEGPVCGYYSIMQDGDIIRLYYRGSSARSDHDEEQYTCVAESADGIHFTRPDLGLHEVAGAKNNNIIWRGLESHNMAVFLDKNPDAKPGERYKALGGIKAPGKNWMHGGTPGGLFAFASPDGRHWKKMRAETVLTKGAFDSQNIAYWDTERGCYVCYSRIFTSARIRAIQRSTSPDFINWSDPVINTYDAGAPAEHFYTSATQPCPGSPHLLVAFPMRFVPSRKKMPAHRQKGVSDAVFMSSRDGTHWDRTFLEAWIRPGPDPLNWTDRNTMPAWGIVETSPVEWSMYVSEHYRHPDNRLRRVSIRKQGFASMHAGAAGGEFVTRPLLTNGTALALNYATSAAGSIKIELQDAKGNPLPGFALSETQEIYGDEIEHRVQWSQKAGPAIPRGMPVRLRFVLRDADLYALRFI